MSSSGAYQAELQQLVQRDEDGVARSGDFVRLAHFPPYVLSIINLNISGISLLRLLSCGSKLLYFKLTKMRGATQFSVIGQVDHSMQYADWRNKNFQSMRVFEGLRSLEIVGLASKSLRNFSTDKFDDLPSTIEVLRFEFLQAFTLWVDLKDHDWTTYQDGDAIRNGKAYHMEEKFPNLESLELTSPYWDRFSHYARKGVTVAFPWTNQMKEEFAAHLPRSLTSLKIHRFEGVQRDIIKFFPEGIKRLEYDFMLPEEINPQAISMGEALPRQLKILKLGRPLGWRELGHLPVALEALYELSTVTNRWLNPDPSTPFFIFPSTLKTLVLRSSVLPWDEPTVMALPRTLTHFQVRMSKEDPEHAFTDSLFELLPPNLEVLILGSAADGPTTTLTPNISLFDRPLRFFYPGTKVLWPWSSLLQLPPTLQTFYTHALGYTRIPDRDDGYSMDEARDYWIDQLQSQLNVYCPDWGLLHDGAKMKAPNRWRYLLVDWDTCSTYMK